MKKGKGVVKNKGVKNKSKILASDLDGPIFLLLFFPRPGIRRFLKQLGQQGFELLVVTARWGWGAKAARLALDFWDIEYLALVSNTANHQKPEELERWPETAFLETDPAKARELAREGVAHIFLLRKRKVDNLPPQVEQVKNLRKLYGRLVELAEGKT